MMDTPQIPGPEQQLNVGRLEDTQQWKLVNT